MEHIRLPLIHPTAFCEEIEMDELMMTSMKLVPIMAEARKYHILGVAGESKRFRPRIKASRIDTLISLGGTDRIGGYNLSYVESWVSFRLRPNYQKLLESNHKRMATNGKVTTKLCHF